MAEKPPAGINEERSYVTAMLCIENQFNMTYPISVEADNKMAHC